jgi:fatty-acyl-CoA synthase
MDHPTRRREQLESRHPRWEPRTLWQLLAGAAESYGERPLILTDEVTYTYAELEAWAGRLAAGLVELGVRPGEHVAMVVANQPEFVAIKFAIARIGAVAVPINFLLREAELAYVLRQSHAVALITMDRFRKLDYLAGLDTIMPGWVEQAGGEAFPALRHVVVFPMDGGEGSWQGLEELETLGSPQATEEIERRDRDADPNAYSEILYTSGTTGSPKGVLLTHDMVVRTAYGSAYSRALPDAHRMLYALPMYHVFGYVECLLATLFVGGAVVPRTVFDPADMLAAVAAHGANEIVCVPTMTFALLDEARANTYDLETLYVVFSSGGPAPDTIWEDIRTVLGPTEITTGYGQTETTAATTCSLPEGSDDYLRTTNGRLRDAGSAGDPELDGRLAVYRVVHVETRVPLSPGEKGEMLVRGPSVTPGYYDKPQETAEAFDADGWLLTGDIGILTQEDDIVLVGRVKESYRCGGEMIMPREVEQVLATHPSVAEAHVVGLSDARMGEVGCACIVAAPGAAPVAEQLIEHCAQHLARFKVPRHVLIVEPEDLPLTVTGRVQKFRLAELAQERLAT